MLDYSLKCVTSNWERCDGKSSESQHVPHPPDGVFAINGTDEAYRSEFRASKLMNSDHGGNSASSPTPGVCTAPKWCGHGSAWIYC